MRRYIVGVPLAVVVSLALFYLMRFLISGEADPPEEGIEAEGIDISRPDRETPIRSEDDIVKKPTMPEPPEMPEPEFPKEEPDGDEIPINPEGMKPKKVVLGDPSDPTRDPQPVVRIEPQYPIKASERDIEGWVIVSFTVTETGAVEGAEVIRCVENDVEKDPSRCVFKSESEKAVNRWKYQPRVEGGNPMRWDQEVLLSFDLAE